MAQNSRDTTRNSIAHKSLDTRGKMAQKSFDTRRNILNTECQVTYVPLCVLADYFKLHIPRFENHQICLETSRNV
jgi:hypothetical protein